MAEEANDQQCTEAVVKPSKGIRPMHRRRSISAIRLGLLVITSKPSRLYGPPRANLAFAEAWHNLADLLDEQRPRQAIGTLSPAVLKIDSIDHPVGRSRMTSPYQASLRRMEWLDQERRIRRRRSIEHLTI
jgi:hypothetical protein